MAKLILRIGDRVWSDRFGSGTVILVSNHSGNGTLVSFDKAHDALHNGNGYGKNLHCYWYNQSGAYNGQQLLLVVRKGK